MNPRYYFYMLNGMRAVSPTLRISWETPFFQENCVVFWGHMMPSLINPL